MVEKRKFAVLAELHRQPAEPETSEPEAPPAAVVAMPVPEKGRGRPTTGKRSNPEWKLYSHFLSRTSRNQ